MAKKSSAGKVRMPLNTQDVTRVAGVSRRVLDRYEQTGLLVPRRLDDSVKAKKQWSIDQAKIAEYVRILQHGDRTLEEIAALADQGEETLLGLTEDQCAQDMRDARRQFKASVKDRRRCRGARRVGWREGLYLRIFPQRWLALAPLPGADGALPDPGMCASLFVELYSVAHVVGWCPTGGTGVLCSLPAQTGGAASTYAYIELASPPMPAPRTGALLDGGCYRSIAADGAGPACEGRCERCTHFGRLPTTEERFRWNARQADAPGLWDKVLMAEDMVEPYPYGIWSGEPAVDGDPRALDAYRPRLMPHTARLPLGITACAFPAGAFLCSQCAEDDEAQAYQRLVGTLLALPRRTFTREDERRLAARRAARPAPTGDAQPPAPYQPLFSQLGITDLGAQSLPVDVDYAQLQSLVLPEGMALPPEDGVCVAYSTMPAGGRNNVPRVELRVLVDARAFAADDFGSAEDLALWV